MINEILVEMMVNFKLGDKCNQRLSEQLMDE